MSASTASDIARVRRFNRVVTRRIGVLDGRFPGRDRPLGESRLLYEIGRNGLEVRELRARLGLDSGYLSRLLRALERQGLIETAPAPHDARMRFARLTRKGMEELGELDRRSDAAARAILARLGATQRRRLVEAMSDVERLLLASDVAVGPEPPGGPAARWCVEQYFALLNDRFEGGYDPGKAAPADTRDFMPPRGVFLVARALGRPVGCGGLKTCAPGTGEIKRLWVDAAARGLGLGQRLLDGLETHARDMGLHTIRLDTNRSLTEAQALYLKNGYREAPPFNDDPYPDHWFEKRLG